MTNGGRTKCQLTQYQIICWYFSGRFGVICYFVWLNFFLAFCPYHPDMIRDFVRIIKIAFIVITTTTIILILILILILIKSGVY